MNLLQLSGNRSPILTVKGKFNFSIWPYIQAVLEAAEHTPNLVKAKNYILNLDYRQAGLGGDDSWSRRSRPYDEHLLSLDGSLKYSFMLEVR